MNVMNDSYPATFFTGSVTVHDPISKEEYSYDDAIIMVADSHFAICSLSTINEILSEFIDRPVLYKKMVMAGMRNYIPENEYSFYKKLVDSLQPKIHRYSNNYTWRID